MSSAVVTETKLSQTEIDHLELDSTRVDPLTARVFSLAFVAILLSVPLLQVVVELRRGQTPGVLQVFAPFVKAAGELRQGRWQGLWNACRQSVEPETLHAYEAALENASVLRGYSQPRLQQRLTAHLGFGSDKVILGEEGWLFYQPGLAYVSRPSIVAKETLDLVAKRAVDKGLERTPQPDPRPALLAFDRDCRRWGARLVVFPAPDKVMLQPAQLYPGLRGAALQTPNNVGYGQLVQEMRAAGMDWFDPAPATVQRSEVRFLRQDTHWTPEYMDSVARELAMHVKGLGVLTPALPAGLVPVSETVSRLGDMVDTLRMTPQQTLFSPQQVTVSKIMDPATGLPVMPDADSEVLVLGDSYTNIYSRPEMGWGAGAGLAEHLAYWLRRRVDVIALNDGGATRSRAEVTRPENLGHRLGRKKVIIYEFAIRNLYAENWRVIPLPPRPPLMTPAPAMTRQNSTKPIPATDATAVAAVSPTRTAAPAATLAAQPLVVSGRILQTSRVPAPGTAPYKDCLTFVKVSAEAIESGSYSEPEMLVVFLAMRDNQWLPAARYTIGDRLRMTLIPLSKAEDRIRTMQRADDIDDFVMRPYYSVQETKQ